MQKNQFTDEQIVAILQQAEKGEQTIAEVCRQHNVSENSFYRWRSRFGSATTNEAARLRELEKENACLKRLLAERDLEVDIIKELLQKSSRGRRSCPGTASQCCLSHRTRPVAAAGLPPPGSRSGDGPLSPAPRTGGDAARRASATQGAVPTLRHPPRPRFIEERRPSHQPQAGAAALA